MITILHLLYQKIVTESTVNIKLFVEQITGSHPAYYKTRSELVKTRSMLNIFVAREAYYIYTIIF